MKLVAVSLTILILLTSCAGIQEAQQIERLDHLHRSGAISAESWYYQRKSLVDSRNARMERIRRGMAEYHAEQRQQDAYYDSLRPRKVYIKPTYGDNWPGHYTGTIY